MYIELSPEDSDFSVVPLEVGIFFFFSPMALVPQGLELEVSLVLIISFRIILLLPP